MAEQTATPAAAPAAGGAPSPKDTPASTAAAPGAGADGPGGKTDPEKSSGAPPASSTTPGAAPASSAPAPKKPAGPSLAEVAREKATARRTQTEAEAAMARAKPVLEAIEKGDLQALLKLSGRSLKDVVDAMAEAAEAEDGADRPLTRRELAAIEAEKERTAAEARKTAEADAKKRADEAWEAKKTGTAKNLREAIKAAEGDRLAKRAPQLLGVDLAEEAVALTEKLYMETGEYLPPDKALEKLEAKARGEILGALGLVEADLELLAKVKADAELLKRLTKAETKKDDKPGKAATPALTGRSASGHSAVDPDEGNDEPMPVNGDLKEMVRATAKRAFKDNPALRQELGLD